MKGTLPSFSCDQATSAMSTRGIPTRIKALRVLMGTAVFVCLFLKLPVWHVKGTLPSFSCDQATSAMSTRGIPTRKTSSLPNPKTDRKLAMINSLTHCLLVSPAHNKMSGPIWIQSILTASIAQLVQRPLSEQEVTGWNPAASPYQMCRKHVA